MHPSIRFDDSLGCPRAAERSEGDFRSAGLRWTQVEPGSFAGSFTSIRLGAARVFRDRFNLGLQLEGSLMPGTLLLGTVADAATHARWFGMPATQGDVAIGHRSVDVNATGRGSFFSVLLDGQRVADGFPKTLGRDASLWARDDAYLVRDATRASSLRAYLRAVFALRDAAPAELHEPAMRRNVERVLIAIIGRSTEGRRIVPGASFSGRFQAVRICEAYMAERIDAPISLRELSDFSGLRQRSLINAFEAFTGLSPMAYLKAQRLNGVRKSLLTTHRSQSRIIDVAMDWGFEHMGHFASDYRTMFGERPSETARAPRCPRHARPAGTFSGLQRFGRLRDAALGRPTAPLALQRCRARLHRLIDAESA